MREAYTQRRSCGFAIAVLSVLLASTSAFSTVIIVDDNHSGASDSNPGTDAEPLKTVQAALDRASDGDTVHIKPGVYDMNGYTRTFDFRVALIGDNPDITILHNGGTLGFSAPFSVRKLGFMHYDPEVFQLVTAADRTLDGVIFDDCLFRRVRVAIDNSNVSAGTVRNVVVRNCRFLDMYNTKVVGIRLESGALENVSIYGNTLRELSAQSKECIGIFVGSNDTRFRTANVYIAGNELNNIVGPTNLVDGVGWEVHGILCYGSNIQVVANSVENVNPGDDHEAIYVKASCSTIADNEVTGSGSGSGGADIALKGEADNYGNLVCANRVTGSLPGRAMMVHGGATVRHNLILKTAGGRGIDAYAYGKTVRIFSNCVEVALGSALSLEDAAGGSVIGNRLVSYSNSVTRIVNCSNVVVAGNTESTVPLDCGWTNEPPVIVSGIVPSETVQTVPTTLLSVTAADPDNGPSPLKYKWTRPTGPGRVVFWTNTAASASSTMATFCEPGYYTIQVEVFDGINRAVDQVLLQVEPASPDTDGDLIADAWEVEYGLDPLDREDGDDDGDGDGITNVDEYAAGSDPTNGNARFAISEFGRIAQGMYLALSSVSGRVYDVDYRNDLVGTNSWAQLTNGVRGTGELLRIMTPANMPQRFYHVRVRVP